MTAMRYPAGVRWLPYNTKRRARRRSWWSPLWWTAYTAGVGALGAALYVLAMHFAG